MTPSRRRSGFTLIEVLIVVVIMAVLAATIIPQFSTSTKDAQTSTVNFNTHTMRNQLELYKAQHGGTYPALSGTDIPNLSTTTNAAGTAGTGAEYPFGPYLSEIPANPFNNDKTVKAGTGAAGDGSSGWQYDAATGKIWPNHTGWTPTP